MSDRELDAWISLHLFNWKWFLLDGKRFLGQPEMTRELAKGDEPIWEGDNIFVFNYTSDLSLAFQVVERMRERGYDVEIGAFIGFYRVMVIEDKTGDVKASKIKHSLADLPRLICECARDVLEPACTHEWIDMRNEHIASGEMCQKCNKIQAGNENTEKNQ